MDSEQSDNHAVENNNVAVTSGVVPMCDDQALETAQTGGEQTQPVPEDFGDDGQAKDPLSEAASQSENRIQQTTSESPAAILSTISGNHNWMSSHLHVHADAAVNLAQFVTENPLQPSKRSYQSVSISDVAGYAGILLTNRILLLSCYSEDVALNVGKSIACESRAASKQLVTIEANCQGTYTIKDLIEELARRKGNDDLRVEPGSQPVTTTVCVWAAHDVGEDDVASAILNSLFSGNAKIEQYQIQLSSHGLCLICLVSPWKLKDYEHSDVKGNLETWKMDFLHPMLEEYGLGQVEELVATIAEQRQQGKWDEDDAEFYKEIGRHLRAGKLRDVVTSKKRKDLHASPDVGQLFDRQDPLADTVLYCATYYPDLSPQEFSRLVHLFLEDETREISKGTDQPLNGAEATTAPEPTLTQRWRNEADAILYRCKLAALTDEDNRRVVNFHVDGLRSRLSRHIRNDHPFFYESRFAAMRRQGLLFSPSKKVAEGARQLLVEMATQYTPNEVANWLYEIVYEFEQTAQTADLLRERSQLFQLLPDARIKAARRYVCRGIGLVLNRLDKEPDLQEAARLFWFKLLQTQRQWFLDLLRQIGGSVPAETLGWLKQILDQGSKDIRDQAQIYLLGYLLRRDSLIYPTLRDLMQWSPDRQAGRAMRALLISYCIETNRQLPQQDYGRWPSSHPLFGFRSRAEAHECLGLLVGWLFDAASEVDTDSSGLSIIADVIAGWYFILTPFSQPESARTESACDGEDELDSCATRQLLLEYLARHCSRQQRRSLLESWEEFRNNILYEVLRFEEFIDHLAEISLNAKLMTDAAAARRKLLDTRASLGQLRRDFMRCATEVAYS